MTAIERHERPLSGPTEVHRSSRSIAGALPFDFRVRPRGAIGIYAQVTGMGCLTDRLSDQTLTRFRRSRSEVMYWKQPGLDSRI